MIYLVSTAVAFSAVVTFFSTANAADTKGWSDHPMISRYQGAEMLSHSVATFDEYALFIRKAENYGGKEKNPDATKPLEGKVTKITYQAPAERAVLEVYRNYADELEKGGFVDVFSCKKGECGGRNFNHAVANSGYFGEDYEEQRYLATKLTRPEGDVYVSLYVVLHNDGGKNNNRVRVQLDVIEMTAMEGNMVVVDAEAMEKGLAAEGHIAIYAVYFDTDSADLKTNSHPALQQIATLLKQQPALKLLIVGHTDNEGGLNHNKDLSRRRAAAVVDALVTRHAISRDRLDFDGVAYLSPVASNRNEDGRAKNRRVELVDNN